MGQIALLTASGWLGRLLLGFVRTEDINLTKAWSYAR
jgi:hypothetical protein